MEVLGYNSGSQYVPSPRRHAAAFRALFVYYNGFVTRLLSIVFSRWR